MLCVCGIYEPNICDIMIYVTFKIIIITIICKAHKVSSNTESEAPAVCRCLYSLV